MQTEKHMKQKFINLTKHEAIRQLFKYGLVGLVGLIIDLGVFYILAKILNVEYPFSAYIREFSGEKMSLHLINTDISHIISSTLAIINNFILNSYFTFKVTDNKLKRFLSFASIAAIGLVISTTLITIFMEKFGMEEMLAKSLAVLIVAALQFLINKLFTFKTKEK